MDVIQELDGLKEQGINESNMDKWYSLFNYDSLNQGLLIKEFYNEFFYKIYPRIRVTERMHDICISYLSNFPTTNNDYRLFYILVCEMYDLRLYSQALSQIKLIKTSSNTTGSFYLGAVGIEVTIYTILGLYDEALKNIEDVRKTKWYNDTDKSYQYVIDYNTSLLYAILKKDKELKKEFLYCSRKYEHLSSTDEYNFFNKLRDCICHIFLGDDLDKYGHFLYNLFINEFVEQDYFLDLHFETKAIKEVKDVLSEVELYNLCKFFIYKFSNLTVQKISFYEILVNNKNSHLTNKDMKDYFDSLKKYYDETNFNLRKECYSFKKFIELNDKLNVISKKYKYDSLTKIFNRNELMELENSILKKGTIVYFFDIDDLKKFNDTLGHQAGDYLLAQFSTILLAKLKDSFDIYRYGGDEFLAVSKEDVSSDNTFIDSIKEECLNERKYKNTTFTISFSYGKYEVYEDIALKYAMYEADKDMYSKKKNKK